MGRADGIDALNGFTVDRFRVVSAEAAFPSVYARAELNGRGGLASVTYWERSRQFRPNGVHVERLDEM
jgi:hypothetical protein